MTERSFAQFLSFRSSNGYNSRLSGLRPLSPFGPVRLSCSVHYLGLWPATLSTLRSLAGSHRHWRCLVYRSRRLVPSTNQIPIEPTGIRNGFLGRKSTSGASSSNRQITISTCINIPLTSSVRLLARRVSLIRDLLPYFSSLTTGGLPRA